MERRRVWLIWGSGVFATVGLVHLVRAGVDVSLVVAGKAVALWVSWLVGMLAVAASIALAIWASRVGSRRAVNVKTAAGRSSGLPTQRRTVEKDDEEAPCCGMHAVIHAADADFVDEDE